MSNWDFGHPPADHRDAGASRDDGVRYPTGGVGWTGNGIDTADLDDQDPAPYPITYERDLEEPDVYRPPATQYEPYAPWPPAQVPDDRFAPDRFAPGQVATGQFATGDFATDQFSTGLYAAPPPAAPPSLSPTDATGPNGTGLWTDSEPGGDRWLRVPSPPPGAGATGELPPASSGAALGGDQLAGEPWAPAPAPAPGTRPPMEPLPEWVDGQWPDDAQWPSQPRPGRSRPGGGGPNRGWLMFAGVAVAAAAIGGTTVVLTSGHPGAQAAGTATVPATSARSSKSATPAKPATSATPKAVPTGRAAGRAKAPSTAAAPAPPLSMAQAKAVLARYTSVNNSANTQRDATRLATIETGGSFAIDSTLYRMQKAAGTAPYPAFSPASATYYIPRKEPTTGPRWFVVQVGNAFASSPTKVSSTEYLLFTQVTPGAPWRNALEPYLLSGANAPRIAVGADGFATPFDATATSLAAGPGQLARITAVSLDGAGPVAAPGNLADRSDQRLWQQKAPNVTFNDTHAPAPNGGVFALPTTGGGALVFYTVAADDVITPPAGSVLRLTVPGLFSPAQTLHRATLVYREQFAAYDPPAGSGTPRIVADYSGITGKV
jgi:hypothetical protein